MKRKIECRFCRVVEAALGPGWLCRLCWRRKYLNKGKGR